MLSKHPFDWTVHFLLCAIPVYFGWATWFVVLIVGIIIEYEQKYQYWYCDLVWKDYFIEKSLGDLIANGLGIVVALLLK